MGKVRFGDDFTALDSRCAATGRVTNRNASANAAFDHADAVPSTIAAASRVKPNPNVLALVAA